MIAGCDALSVHLIVTNLAASMGMGVGWRATLFSMGVMGPWALAHWEEYHSGTTPHLYFAPREEEGGIINRRGHHRRCCLRFCLLCIACAFLWFWMILRIFL